MKKKWLWIVIGVVLVVVLVVVNVTRSAGGKVESVQLAFTGPTTAWPDFVRCIQALASVFDTLSTAPLDRQKVREHFFKRKK